jgi:peroxiredoxin
MAQFEPLKGEIDKLGALLYVAAEKRTGVFHPEKFFTEHQVSFPFLLDEDRAVTKSYGVYHRIGLDAFNIARPATFVVDIYAMARFAYVGIDQRDRAPLEAVMHTLRGLKRPESGKYSAEQ